MLVPAFSSNASSGSYCNDENLVLCTKDSLRSWSVMVTQPSKKFWASFFLFFKCFRICWSFDFRSVFSKTHSLILGMLCVVWDWKKRGDDRIHWSVNPLISTSDDVKQWIPTGSDRLDLPLLSNIPHIHISLLFLSDTFSHDFFSNFF